jgi:undecaprenyl-diphosphatase
MTALQAVILGLVEGITEFLPVSSTAHLLLAQRLLGIPDDDASKAYAICIQAGAILAVLVLWSHRVRAMAWGVVGRDPDGRGLLIRLVVAFIPAAVLGVLFDDLIEAWLFGLWPIVASWTVGGLGIVWLSRSERGRRGRGIEAMDLRTALLIGLCQCVAMWPGTSRSLATIVGGLLLGLSLPAALEFSFLLGLVTLGAATAFKALGHADDMAAAYGPAPILIGFATAAVSAFAAIKWMIAWLEQRGLTIFAVWRIGLALVVAAALLGGVLKN